jgi:collagenase-like PrtC family protease
MKIKAPVNSIVSAKLQIAAGADELFLGMDTDVFANLSFTARSKRLKDGTLLNPREEDFKTIVKYAHDHNVLIDYTANLLSLQDDPDNGHSLEEKFMEYIASGIDAGIDSITVADLGALFIIKKMGITIPIYASVIFNTINIEQIRFFHDLGVTSIILSNSMAIPEMKQIVDAGIMEIGVFVNFGCSNFEGACMLVHNAGEQFPLGIPCGAIYHVDAPEKSTDTQFMFADKSCTICRLPDLMDAGIHKIKLLGRSINSKLSASLTKVYKDSITAYQNNATVEDVKKEIISRYDIWDKLFCSDASCKYLNTSKVTKSLAGLN